MANGPILEEKSFREKNAQIQAEKIKHTFTRPNAFGMSELWVLLSSCFYWAWFDTAIFTPTLLAFADPLGNLYFLHVTIAMASGAMLLLFGGLRPELYDHYVRNRFSPMIDAVTASAASALTLVGGLLSSAILVVLAAIIMGASCSSGLLRWAHVYSRRGMQSSALLISLAIVFGVLIDALVMGLTPGFGAAFIICMPLVAFAIGFFLTNVGSDVFVIEPECQSSGQVVGEGAPLSVRDIFKGQRRTFFGLSLPLVASFALFGLSFGYIQCNSIVYLDQLGAGFSFLLIASRGITALAVFTCIYLWPQRIYLVFRVGIMVGIAGFSLIPLLSMFLGNSTVGIVVSCAIMIVGYTTFDIVTWTILGEISFATRRSATRYFGPGRFIVHISIVVGYLATMVISMNAQDPRVVEGFAITIGYLLVIAVMLLLDENSALWKLIKLRATGVNPADAVDETVDARRAKAVRLVETYGLTKRESEILDLLIAGRSRSRIAEILVISENTVGTHIQQLYKKLNVHSLQELLDMLE
ncbi:MAG: hypothetical protein IKE43_13335 [Coriobacteriales bacterium]|nr:hypothetical protein [Coriobacteriales bacterium]